MTRKKMLWPRIAYWFGFAVTIVGLFYALTGVTNEPSLLHKSAIQTGGAAFALCGFLMIVGGKAWMDAVARRRSRVSCVSCNRLIEATLPHCAHCGAPLRTSAPMLRALADLPPLAQRQPLFCSGCGSEAASNAAFCRRCGRSPGATVGLASA